MRARYLSNPDYNFEKVNRASLACGPMVKWAIAQVQNINYYLKKKKKQAFDFHFNYSIFLDRICRYVEKSRTTT